MGTSQEAMHVGLVFLTVTETATVTVASAEVQSQQGGGRLWREDECEGISHGVQSIIHGCERALEGLEWLEWL